MFLTLAVPPPPPAPAAKICGPPAPAIRGIAPASLGFSLDRVTRNALREIPGAVVVIEDEAPAFLNKLPANLRFSALNLRVFGGRDQPIFPGTPPMPVWMDPSITVSGGNVVHRVFTLGGGSF